MGIITWEEYLQQAREDYAVLLRAYESTLPRHPQLGVYLAANPVKGVSVDDRDDGLGPRAVGWPEGVPHPDVDAWVAAQEAVAAEQAKRDAEQATTEALSAQDRAGKVAQLQADYQCVTEALETGASALSKPEVVAAVLRIAAAGAQRLQT